MTISTKQFYVHKSYQIQAEQNVSQNARKFMVSLMRMMQLHGSEKKRLDSHTLSRRHLIAVPVVVAVL